MDTALADSNSRAIESLTADVKEVTKSVKELAITMAGFADYKEDMAKLEGKIEQLSKENREVGTRVTKLESNADTSSKAIDAFKREQKQGIGFVIALLLAIIGKLIYPMLGA